MQASARARRGLTLAALTLVLCACGDDSDDGVDAGADAGSAAVTPPGASPAAGPRRTITLITGDRVIAHGDDRLSIEPAPGRARTGFHRFRAGGHEHVIPADAAHLVATGALDRRLFDVTGLLELGYTDEQRADLPLLVSYRRGAQRASGWLAAGGAQVTRTLASIDGAAVRAPTGGARAMWSALAGSRAAPALAGGVARVWLDGRRQMLLDVSAPQIGAPAAWDAGLTGAGVTVAVLDSGIAADHPDFAGRIAEARSFLDSAPDATDDVGHGTHVASILAGSGAGADGRYRGIAPDAALVIGKVCDLAGCPDSALLAGMEWAAASGAAVINISLGGPDTPDVDPLEQAIDALTAEHGALFVVSAGNSGLCGGLAGDQASSPSTADAALSVAAVDAGDQVADFSCRGPRFGDGAIKPDIAAPGVRIAAALATGTVIGEPVDDLYSRLSGTSMAAPHAAGAAALLAQLHPDWRAGELKAALMASATSADDPDVFRRGAGRVDLARAIAQDVIASPASLSLGLQRWPHGDDQPIVSTVTYLNSGSAAVALQLAFEIAGPEGTPAPGTFAVEPAELTVPPGAVASATVTVDTRAAPEGVHAGVLVASAADQTVRTPIAVDVEPESYDLELVHLDRAGNPSTAFTLLFDLDSGDFVFLPEAASSTTLRLRRGRFHLESTVGGIDTDGREYAALLVQPLIDLHQDVSIALDARLASPVSITVPRGTARRFVESVDYVRYAYAPSVLSSGYTYRGDIDDGDAFGLIYTAHLEPAVAADTFRSLIQSVWGDPGPPGEARRFDDSTYGYHLVFIPEAGRLPTGWTRRIAHRDVATVHADYAAEGQGMTAEFIALAVPRGDFASHLVPFWHFRLPMSRTEYYTTEEMDWRATAAHVSDDGSWRSDFLAEPPVTYVAGRRHHIRWNGAVLGPALRSPETSNARIARLGDQLLVDVLTLYSDGDDHLGFSSTQTGTTRVFQDGTLIGESDQQPAFALVDVPPEPAAYRVEVEALRGGGAELSSQISVTWSFRSAHVSDEEVTAVPALAVRFSPRLDEYNRAPAGRHFLLPMRVAHQGGVPAAPVRRLSLSLSHDGGQSWREAPVLRFGDFAVALVHHPHRAGTVSLRASAEDDDGTSVEQTIRDAYRIR